MGKGSELWLLQTQHMSGHLWHRYSVSVTHVVVLIVKLLTWWYEGNNYSLFHVGYQYRGHTCHNYVVSCMTDIEYIIILHEITGYGVCHIFVNISNIKKCVWCDCLMYWYYTRHNIFRFLPFISILHQTTCL
jgi:hypothetical protein